VNYSTKSTGLQVHHIRMSKRQSLTLAYVLYLEGVETGDNACFARASYVQQCSSWWQGLKCPTCGQLHSMITYGCHHRLCPICSVRKSRAVAAQAMQVIAQVQEKGEYDYSLLTLTQRNVPAEALRGEIDRMLSAWSSVRYLRQIRRDLVGWARTIEITVGRDGTYHPHIHCILITRPRSPLSQSATWRQIWAQAMDLNYDPVCDCRPIKDITAIYEVSKYVTKLAKVFDGPLGEVYDTVKTLEGATYHRRLRSYGGLWASIRRAMAMVDVDEMDDGALDAAGAMLDGHDDVCSCGTKFEPVCLIWSGMDYEEVSPSWQRKISDFNTV